MTYHGQTQTACSKVAAAGSNGCTPMPAGYRVRGVSRGKGNVSVVKGGTSIGKDNAQIWRSKVSIEKGNASVPAATEQYLLTRRTRDRDCVWTWS